MITLRNSLPILKRWSHVVIRSLTLDVPAHHSNLHYCCPCLIHSPTMSYKIKSKQVRQMSYKKNSTEELISYGDELLEELSSHELDGEDIDVIKNNLSGILYLLHKNEDPNLIPYIERIRAHTSPSDAGYDIIMRYYADQKDVKNVNCVFNMLRENKDIKIHSRSYVPLIIVSLRLGEIEQCGKYLKEMVTFMRPKFNDNSFHDIINVCTELRTEDNHDMLHRFVEEVFYVFEEFGSSELDKKLVNAICSWFMCDPKNQWKITKTYMGKKDGMCQYCKKRLTKAIILPDRLTKLKENILTLVNAAIIKKETETFSDIKISQANIKDKDEELCNLLTSEFVGKKSVVPNVVEDAVHSESLLEGILHKLGNFENYLHVHGPFDIVIDVLNMGYSKDGFDPVLAKNVVDVFIEQKKHILILCAGIMRRELLTMQKVPPANKRLQRLMLYLNHYCSLFFVGSSSTDDYYILYSLVHHNFNIQLVSGDLFRGHLFHLDADNTVDFQRWQKANQYIMRATSHDGKPIFLDFHIGMQKHEAGWHVPIGGRGWYCISNN